MQVVQFFWQFDLIQFYENYVYRQQGQLWTAGQRWTIFQHLCIVSGLHNNISSGKFFVQRQYRDVEKSFRVTPLSKVAPVDGTSSVQFVSASFLIWTATRSYFQLLKYNTVKTLMNMSLNDTSLSHSLHSWHCTN